MTDLPPARQLPQTVRSLARTALRHVRPTGWLRLPSTGNGDVAVKPAAYLPVYEELLSGLRFRRFSLLELGVWKGDSLVLWRDAFPRARIVGVDLQPPELELGPRVTIIAGDQTDAELLGRIRREHAPDGFEVIVDDASHVGQLSARSLQALFIEHLRPGGLYIIEDWGTGYLPSWPDGGTPAAVIGIAELDRCAMSSGQASDSSGSRMPGHDAGMVGLVKRLVDHTAARTLGVYQPDRVDTLLPIEWMRVQDGLVILKKRS